MNNHNQTRSRRDGFHTPHAALRTSVGFTLIELLVVISIIAILAALLLPAISKVKVRAQIKKAQMEIGQIANAIHSYESDYSKFPVSSVGANNAMTAASASGDDFTYGTFGVNCVGPSGGLGVNNGFKTPTGTYAIPTPASSYPANNSEVMVVLLDVESWPLTGVTINQGHVKNPQKTRYLNANTTGTTSLSGVGPDGVYRDPWGNPYIITVDLNYDDKARDAFYRLNTVSVGGINGLISKVVNGATIYEAASPVMIWSAGPDKMIDPTVPANKGANTDNILSWKQ
ncbi:MAG: prepilin-type N-terminal cleavage/methylation domain-containing protein [Verrucomicrobia bacterium]|nr:prepilin-type N-terminal cleavage/methylation domain-containing protein [Verrucomicrobiota bacterium]